MTRLAGIVAAIAAVLAALYLLRERREAPRVDRDAWPEGVGSW